MRKAGQPPYRSGIWLRCFWINEDEAISKVGRGATVASSSDITEEKAKAIRRPPKSWAKR